MHAERFWTEAKDAMLTRLWSDGATTPKIAEALGATKNAIVGRAHRLNLPARESPIKRTAIVGPPMPPRPRRAPRRTLAIPKSEPAPPAPPAIRASTAKCLWPLWRDTERPTHRYCDAPKRAGLAYCPDHCGRAYVTPRDIADRAAA